MKAKRVFRAQPPLKRGLVFSQSFKSLPPPLPLTEHVTTRSEAAASSSSEVELLSTDQPEVTFYIFYHFSTCFYFCLYLIDACSYRRHHCSGKLYVSQSGVNRYLLDKRALSQTASSLKIGRVVIDRYFGEKKMQWIIYSYFMLGIRHILCIIYLIHNIVCRDPK